MLLYEITGFPCSVCGCTLDVFVKYDGHRYTGYCLVCGDESYIHRDFIKKPMIAIKEETARFIRQIRS